MPLFVPIGDLWINSEQVFSIRIVPQREGQAAKAHVLYRPERGELPTKEVVVGEHVTVLQTFLQTQLDL